MLLSCFRLLDYANRYIAHLHQVFQEIRERVVTEAAEVWPAAELTDAGQEMVSEASWSRK